ncbi:MULTISPECIES: ParA family protein [unclassified Burkholderia]|uniref:ParA family protein n=1 Tax=unclassified Burkholderia TaxID=2613784 RepID=UPI002AB1F42C|nr:MULTISPECIES: ParA family protein [unclassified Burkholderia]
MSNTPKQYKTLAVAQLLGISTDILRRAVEESGIEIARQETGPKTRLFSIDKIFDLAHYRAKRRNKNKLELSNKQVVATIYAPKGGVGKTTLAANLGTQFALMGLRTLIIDIDFQANLTLAFGYDPELTMEEAAAQGVPPESVVEHHFGNVIPEYPMTRVALHEVIKKPYGECGPHILPAELELDRVDAVLTYESIQGRNSSLPIVKLMANGQSGKDSYFDISGYDVVLFDAPPAKNRLTQGALLASDFVISPVSMEKFSTKALSYLSSVLTQMQEDFSRSPELIIVGNFFDAARVRVQNQLTTISQTYKDALLDRAIRKNEDFPRALESDYDLPLTLHKPSSPATADLRECAAALLQRMGVTDGQ